MAPAGYSLVTERCQAFFVMLLSGDLGGFSNNKSILTHYVEYWKIQEKRLELIPFLVVL